MAKSTSSKNMHVKKGDRVKVITGKDRGVIAEVIEAFPAQGKVKVQGVNIVKRHQRESATPDGAKIDGGIIHFEAPIDASNVQLVVDIDGTEVTTRVGYKRVEVAKRRADGSEYSAHRSVRIARKTGEEI